MSVSDIFFRDERLGVPRCAPDFPRPATIICIFAALFRKTCQRKAVLLTYPEERVNEKPFLLTYPDKEMRFHFDSIVLIGWPLLVFTSEKSFISSSFM